MKVGILGSGVVAQALGLGFASRGHEVKLGSRTPQSEKLQAWLQHTKGHVSTGTFAQAATHGDVLVLATLGAGTEAAIELAGPAHFAGKLVIDATNALDGAGGLFVGLTDSLGERIQRKLPQARVVKCFNTVPNVQMVDPKFKEAEMLICGNEASAKQAVTKLLKEFGWSDAIDIGGIENARWLEALVPLWVRVGMALNTWSHVFNVLR